MSVFFSYCCVETLKFLVCDECAMYSEAKIYRCMRCGRVFSKLEMETLPGIRCPYCGFRIVEKIRPAIPKRVKAL